MANQGLLSCRRAVFGFYRQSADCVFQHALGNTCDLGCQVAWPCEHEGVPVVSRSSRSCWKIGNKEFSNVLDFLL